MGEDHRDVIDVGHHTDNSSRCRSEKKNKLDINYGEVSHSEVVFMRYLSLLSLLILSFSVCSTFLALSSSTGVYSRKLDVSSNYFTLAS